MGLEDLVNKGKEMFEQNKDKVQDVLQSEQAENISDNVLDGVAGFAKKVAPGAADQIDGVRDNIDNAIGDNGADAK